MQQAPGTFGTLEHWYFGTLVAPSVTMFFYSLLDEECFSDSVGGAISHHSSFLCKFNSPLSSFFFNSVVLAWFYLSDYLDLKVECEEDMI